MTRNEMINTIKEWAAPISTFTGLDDFENYKNINIDRYRTIPEASEEILMDILLNLPTEDEIAPVDIVYFTYELVDALTYIGQRNTKKSLKALEGMLHLAKSKSHIIDVIGGLKDEDGIAILESLLEEELSDDEIVHIASALSEIGGEKTQDVLLVLEGLCKYRPLEVLRKIEIYLN